MAKIRHAGALCLMPISLHLEQLPTSLWLKSSQAPVENVCIFHQSLPMFSPIICRWLSYCFTLDPSTNSPFTRPSKRWSWSPLAVMADPSWWTCRDPTVGTKRGAPNQLKSSSLINPAATNQWVIWKLAKLNNTAPIPLLFRGERSFSMHLKAIFL